MTTTTNSATTTPHPRSASGREDCWSEEASATLIDVWGRRYLELNRGNLRQKDWQQVADFVNARHSSTFRTDVQCKNRVDTIKKKYKTEKAKSFSTGAASSWSFYNRLHHLVGPAANSDTNSSSNKSAVVGVANSRSQSPPMALPLPIGYRHSTTPLPTAVVLPKKRPLPMDDSYFRRNYSAVAAAAAAAAIDDDEEEEEEDDDDVDEEEEEEDDGLRRGRGEEGSEEEDGIKKLAQAIRRFGDVYERVEAEKQSQMIELEKQRMQLAKDLEVQRMQMFVNMQLQLKKIKMSKRPNGQTS